MVRRGDRLGVFSERRRSPVAYVFDGSNPRTVAHSFTNHTHPVGLGQTVTFDPLVFPYAFSAAAYYYVVGRSININIYEHATLETFKYLRRCECNSTIVCRPTSRTKTRSPATVEIPRDALCYVNQDYGSLKVIENSQWRSQKFYWGPHPSPRPCPSPPCLSLPPLPFP